LLKFLIFKFITPVVIETVISAVGERIKLRNEIVACTKNLSPTSNMQPVFKKGPLWSQSIHSSVFSSGKDDNTLITYDVMLFHEREVVLENRLLC
jgi:hypothetical protein